MKSCDVFAKSSLNEEAGGTSLKCVMEDRKNMSETEDLDRDVLAKSTNENQEVFNDGGILAEESIEQDDEYNYYNKQEAARDKLIDEIFVYATPEPMESLEVREKFAFINSQKN